MEQSSACTKPQTKENVRKLNKRKLFTLLLSFLLIAGTIGGIVAGILFFAPKNIDVNFDFGAIHSAQAIPQQNQISSVVNTEHLPNGNTWELVTNNSKNILKFEVELNNSNAKLDVINVHALNKLVLDIFKEKIHLEPGWLVVNQYTLNRHSHPSLIARLEKKFSDIHLSELVNSLKNKIIKKVASKIAGPNSLKSANLIFPILDANLSVSSLELNIDILIEYSNYEFVPEILPVHDFESNLLLSNPTTTSELVLKILNFGIGSGAGKSNMKISLNLANDYERLAIILAESVSFLLKSKFFDLFKNEANPSLVKEIAIGNSIDLYVNNKTTLKRHKIEWFTEFTKDFKIPLFKGSEIQKLFVPLAQNHEFKIEDDVHKQYNDIATLIRSGINAIDDKPIRLYADMLSIPIIIRLPKDHNLIKIRNVLFESGIAFSFDVIESNVPVQIKVGELSYILQSSGEPNIKLAVSAQVPFADVTRTNQSIIEWLKSHLSRDKITIENFQIHSNSTCDWCKKVFEKLKISTENFSNGLKTFVAGFFIEKGTVKGSKMSLMMVMGKLLSQNLMIQKVNIETTTTNEVLFNITMAESSNIIENNEQTVINVDAIARINNEDSSKDLFALRGEIGFNIDRLKIDLKISFLESSKSAIADLAQKLLETDNPVNLSLVNLKLEIGQVLILKNKNHSVMLSPQFIRVIIASSQSFLKLIPDMSQRSLIIKKSEKLRLNLGMVSFDGGPGGNVNLSLMEPVNMGYNETEKKIKILANAGFSGTLSYIFGEEYKVRNIQIGQTKNLYINAFSGIEIDFSHKNHQIRSDKKIFSDMSNDEENFLEMS